MAQNVNYQHLYYFWNVVKEDSFTKASRKLGLAQPTISGQISTFEKSLGFKLLTRQGRRINLTDTGHVVYNYAEKIFSLGEKMNEDIKLSSFVYFHTLAIGFRNSIPSHVTGKLSKILFEKIDDYRLTCFNDNNAALLNGVAQKYLDVAITDEPLSYLNGLPLYAHLLMESDISIYCHSRYSEEYSKLFPDILERRPCVMPSPNTRMRTLIDEYLLHHQIKPLIVAEVENYDILTNMAETSPYMFFAPSIIQSEIESQTDCREIRKLPKSVIKYYAVTINKQPDKEIISYIIHKSRSAGF
jgi:LysR family transcriptional activator of nhaA